MNTGRHAFVFSLLRQPSRPLSNHIWTLQIRGESRYKRTGCHGFRRKTEVYVERFVRIPDSRFPDASSLNNLFQHPRKSIAATGTIHAGRGDRFDRPPSKEALVLGAPEQLTCLVANRVGELECTRKPADLAGAQ